jgi:hypothetical protein
MRLLTSLLAAVFAVLFSGTAFATCPAHGDASSDTIAYDMNPLKNRTADPGNTQDVSVADILGYSSDEDTSLEQEGVVLTGQLLTYKHEGAESPNCHSSTRKDYHIWIGAMVQSRPNGQTLSATALRTAKRHSVIVELTPRIQDRHPSWGSRLASIRYKYVCIRGWLFFDHEHADQVGNTRGTQWEVHPITAIGLLNDDGTCDFWN